MIKNTVSIKVSGIPWGDLLKEAVCLLKSSNLAIYGFLVSFFLLSLLGQFDDFDWRNLSPLQLWVSITITLLNFAISYFVFITFVLWIRGYLPGNEKPSMAQMMKSASALLFPLTVLSLRGAILSLVGLIFFFLPGIYFYFKYELASLCLILEGWQDDASPITRAEQIISRNKFELLLLAVLMFFEWMVPWLLEQSAKFGGLQMNWGLRIGVAFLDSSISLGATIYVTLVVLFLMKQTPITSQTINLSES